MPDTYDFKSAGFDEFMKRRISTSSGLEQQTGDETSYQIKHLSGTSITSGKSKSSDDKMSIDWDKASFVASDGARNRVEIGKIIGTEEYGIRIIDVSGNEVFSTTGSLGGIVLGGDNMTLDGQNNQFILRDENGKAVVLIGYQENGF